MYRDGHLFVNGFVTGHSFVIDLRDPMNPSVAAHFTDVGEFNVETAAPRISHVYTFAMDDWKEMCALPVTVGHFWIRTVPTRNGLVVLDVSDPSEPQEVGYVFMGEGHIPHWRGTGRGR